MNLCERKNNKYKFFLWNGRNVSELYEFLNGNLESFNMGVATFSTGLKTIRISSDADIILNDSISYLVYEDGMISKYTTDKFNSLFKKEV